MADDTATVPLRGEPRLQDIANKDFPEIQEWKQHRSNWGLHRAESTYANDLKSVAQSLTYALLFSALISAAVDLASNSAIQAAFERIFDLAKNWSWRAIGHWLGVALRTVGRLWGELAENPEHALGAWLNIIFILADNALRSLVGFVMRNILLFSVLVLLKFVEGRSQLNGMLKRIQAVLGVQFFARYSLRAVWLGNGQVQFGCGPKGISVEHHHGFTYLLRWEKVELIYNGDFRPHGSTLQNPVPFNEISGVPIFLGSPSSTSQVLNPALPQKFRADIVKAIEFAAKADVGNKKSIRVRLVHSVMPKPKRNRVWPWNWIPKGKEPPNELIVPKELFDLTNPWTWQRFMEACWQYKYFPEPPAEGKSIGSINSRKPSTGVLPKNLAPLRPRAELREL
jgi:hypothetical protein